MGSRVSGGSCDNAHCEDDRTRYFADGLCQLFGRLGVPGDDRADPRHTRLSLKARKELGLVTALLSCAGQKQSASVAQHLLDRFGSLSAILFADMAALQSSLSTTPAIATLLTTISAAVSHALADDIGARVLIDNRTALYRYVRARLGSASSERFHILYLSSACHLISDEVMGLGALTNVAVYPRNIIARALEHSAAAMIIVHITLQAIPVQASLTLP
jgi:DNA repair protein RadC